MTTGSYTTIEDTLAASKIFYTTGQVANILKECLLQVDRWFDKGYLSGFRVPSSKQRRHRRISRESLIQYIRLNYKDEKVQREMIERANSYIKKASGLEEPRYSEI
jgi:hypothetical protein